MRPVTITLGAALFLVVGTSSAIILRQHAELEVLRARQPVTTAERPPLLPVATEVPLHVEPGPEETPVAEPVQPAIVPLNAEVAQQRPSGRQRGASRFAELLADPEVAALAKAQRRADLDGRYAAAFRKLNLSAPEIDALKDLLAEKQLARMEVGAVARAEGMMGNERDVMRDLLRESDEEVESRIQNLLGADRYAELQNFEETTQERTRVRQLDTRLSYSQTPLQDFQSEALVGILASVEEPRPFGRSRSTDTASYLDELRAYDAQVYTRAQSVLNPAQLAALREMQVERQDRVRLGQLMRQRGDVD